MLKSIKHRSGKRAKTGLRMEKQSSLPRIFYLVFEENESVLRHYRQYLPTAERMGQMELMQWLYFVLDCIESVVTQGVFCLAFHIFS